jgi:hypothetical protein
MPEAAGVIASRVALAHLQLAPEAVERGGGAMARKQNPKPAGQIEIFDLYNRSALTRACTQRLRHPKIANLQVVNQNLASPRSGPVAERFRVTTAAKAAFLTNHKPENTAGETRAPSTRYAETKFVSDLVKPDPLMRRSIGSSREESSLDSRSLG